MRLRLDVARIVDEGVRTSIDAIREFFRTFTLANFVTYRVDLSLSAPVYPATLALGHSLPGVPTDAWTTYLSGGTLVWNLDQSSLTQFSVTISAAVKVRGFIGLYRSDA